MDLQKHFRSAFTVDNVIFGFDNNDLKVLLIKRGEEPFRDRWGLPGYFVNEIEDLDSSASRILEELTGITDVYLEQVKAFGSVGRHPQGRVITIAYYSLIKIDDYNKHLKVGSIASEAKWFSVAEVLAAEMPFDHNDILVNCFSTLKKRVRQQPVGFELLPQKFTLSELQDLYEAILESSLDKRNFRKKILSMNLLVDLDQLQEGVAHRPAKLYQFDKRKYQEFLSEGYSFVLKESKKKKSSSPNSQKGKALAASK